MLPYVATFVMPGHYKDSLRKESSSVIKRALSGEGRNFRRRQFESGETLSPASSVKRNGAV